ARDNERRRRHPRRRCRLRTRSWAGDGRRGSSRWRWSYLRRPARSARPRADPGPGRTVETAGPVDTRAASVADWVSRASPSTPNLWRRTVRPAAAPSQATHPAGPRASIASLSSGADDGPRVADSLIVATARHREQLDGTGHEVAGVGGGGRLLLDGALFDRVRGPEV